MDKESGPRSATIEDVARQAGVSTATVSRTFAGNYPVAESTRLKVTRAATDLGYIPNAHAQALAGSRVRSIGIVLNDLVDPFFAFIARGAEQAASSLGRLSLIAATGGNADREIAVTDLLLQQRTNLVILVGGSFSDESYRRKMAARARALHGIGSALVLCGRPSLGVDDLTCQIEYDNADGAAAVTDHLISRGHERILYLGGPDGLSTTAARLEGHRRALTARGIRPDPGLVEIGSFGREFGYATLSRRLERARDFTAIFAANDIVAEGAYQALREKGLQVPTDVSIVGYDDVPVARQLSPGLTTVRIPLEGLGAEAVRIGLAAVDGPKGSARSVQLGTHVILRGSTAERPGARRRPVTTEEEAP